MNEFGLSLLWSMLQVRVLCVVAMPIYLLARRSHPRTGALATLTSLLLITLVTMSAVSPWPRWSIANSQRHDAAAAMPADVSSGDAPVSEIENDPAKLAVDVSSTMLLVEAAGDLWNRLGQQLKQVSRTGVESVSTATLEKAGQLAWTGWHGFRCWNGCFNCETGDWSAHCQQTSKHQYRDN